MEWVTIELGWIHFLDGRALSRMPDAIHSLKLTVLLLLTALSTTFGQETEGKKGTSREDVVAVSQVGSRGRTTLVVQNHAAYDATVTLKITTDNGTVIRIKDETETYPAHSETPAARIIAADPGKRWKIRYRFHWVRGDMHAQHDDSALYQLPYPSGFSHRVVQGYNGMTHHGHDQYAVDFGMREGSSVCAARDGVVVDLREDSKVGGPEQEYRDKSNFVSIRHADGTIGEYYHLKYEGVLVEIGQHVQAGDRIGLSGNTGYSSRPHLHFGVYSAVDGNHIESHPVTFTSRQGSFTTPRRGRIYTAN